MAITKPYQRVASLALVMLVSLLGLGLLPTASLAAPAFGNDAFSAAYNANPALWGASGQILTEQYKETSGGKRLVQYFDKGRMELTYPTTQPNFTGNGKLVVEMVSGRMQIGDTLYWQYDGAEMPVAGGSTFGANPGAPSYRAFQSLTGPVVSRVGRAVTAVLNSPEGEGYNLAITSTTSDLALGTLARYAAYIPETGHNVPDVFWSYLNQAGANGLPAFNWESVFGLPITDSYWVKVRDGAAVSDVLVQLFERRTLLYNPALSVGSQVDSGPVGRDYYRWRYEQPELPVVDTSFTPPDNSPNVSTTPNIGEAGTTFRFQLSGYTPHEIVDLYVRVSPDGGVYPQRTFQADEHGNLRIRSLTEALLDATEERYYVFTGESSGLVSTAHIKVIGSERYTPAVESVQPTTVPDGQGATVDEPVVRIGQTTNLVAEGFKPEEHLQGWVTTPLNRVVGWAGLVNSLSTVASYSYDLKTDENGTFKIALPAPGVAEPGIYAFTLFSPATNKTAIAYFRVKTGPAPLFDPFWGTFDFAPSFGGAAKDKPIDLTTLAQNPLPVQTINVEQEQ